MDPKWKFGQFTNPDPKLRREAIDLAKRAADVAQHMEAGIMVYWPAQDGYDYLLQIDHHRRLDDLVAGLAEWTAHNPQQKVVLVMTMSSPSRTMTRRCPKRKGWPRAWPC